MGPKLSVGSSLAKMALMLKLQGFMEASQGMILIEMMLSSISTMGMLAVEGTYDKMEAVLSQNILLSCSISTMGMLAVKGTYDKMEALLSQNIHPVDILLMLAASEGDKPKIEELLRAGASYTVKDADGRTALERASSEEIKEFILNFSAQKA